MCVYTITPTLHYATRFTHIHAQVPLGGRGGALSQVRVGSLVCEEGSVEESNEGGLSHRDRVRGMARMGSDAGGGGVLLLPPRG